MAQYDPAIIETFADNLYRQADGILITYAIVGGLIGLVGAAVLLHGTFGAIVGAFLAGAVGANIGRQKGFVLRLQAQTALCQTQIERNTRP